MVDKNSEMSEIKRSLGLAVMLMTALEITVIGQWLYIWTKSWHRYNYVAHNKGCFGDNLISWKQKKLKGPTGMMIFFIMVWIRWKGGGGQLSFKSFATA